MSDKNQDNKDPTASEVEDPTNENQNQEDVGIVGKIDR
jgi:hypothetical protein